MASSAAAIEVVIFSVADVAPALRTELEGWDKEQFGQIPYEWTPAEGYATAHLRGRLVGALEIVTRGIRVGAESVWVAGIGRVKTRTEFRLMGIASAMLAGAATLMRDRLVAEFGLLLCQRRTGRVYEKAGWMRVEGPTRFRQGSGMTTYPHDTMVLKLGMGDWLGGLIDLCAQPW